MSDIGKNAGKAAGNAVGSIRKLARTAARSTRRLGRITQLNLSIADEKKNIRHLYTDIGRLYYEAHKDDPEGFFVQLFQQLDASMDALNALETELGTLKAEKAPDEADSGIEVEICIEPDNDAADTDDVPDTEPGEELPAEE